MSTGERREPTLVRFPLNTDPRGSLRVGQFPGQLPFRPVRFFLVDAVPAGETRGDHAHRECHQLLIATQGRVDIEIVEPDGTPTRIELSSPDEGLHIPPLVWARQHYVGDGAQLLVLASHPYAATEYITDFDEYTRLRG